MAVLSLPGRPDQRQVRGDCINGDFIRAVRIGLGLTQELCAMVFCVRGWKGAKANSW